jgi:hypothetical protein
MSATPETKEARIENLNKVQAERKQQALERVNQALERMVERGTKINFSTVAQEANVSVSYLYKYPEVKVRIAELRNQQSVMLRPRMAEPSSNKSHQKIVNRLKERIKSLSGEITELKRINQGLAGRVYRISELEAMVERQRKHIEDLESRLKDSMAQEQPFPIADSKVTSISSAGKSGISSRIKSELESLGIKLNSTLTKKIKASTEDNVLAAIDALKDQLKRSEVKNPGGWLARAIEGGWTKAESLLQQKPVTQTEIFTASPEPEKELVSVDKLKALSSIFSEKDESC